VTRTPNLPRAGVFLDTSGLYAALDQRSDHHLEVAAELERLLRGGIPLLTTDAVLNEFHGLALGRLGPAIALDALDRLLSSPRLRVAATGPGPIRSAVDFLRARPDRRISLVDALSFATMREQNVDTALTLDADFAAEGFTTVP
jgi:predicted nucleic acid-binding protein